MNSQIKAFKPGLSMKANDMTHGLKVRGNGSMLAGIRNMCMDAYNAGMKKGIVYGIVGTVTVRLVYEGGRWGYSKIKLLNKESQGGFGVSKAFTQEQVKNAKLDTKFPWEKVKAYIKSNYNISALAFETWIEPLKCNAYSDRILLELPEVPGVEIAYIKEVYKILLKNSVYEVTGKKYIVSFVRPGEILIEDDI